jgi:predicted site-specific integrase-resolvase
MTAKQNFRPFEAAEYLCVGLSTIWLYAKQGRIHPVKLSDRVTIFTRDDLDAFIAGSIKRVDSVKTH